VPERVKLIYLPAAVRDLEEILDYVRGDSMERAAKLLDKLEVEIGRLARFPRLGVIPSDPHLARKGYRVLIIENYLGFYVVLKNAVRIRRVIHGARRYEFLL